MLRDCIHDLFVSASAVCALAYGLLAVTGTKGHWTACRDLCGDRCAVKMYFVWRVPDAHVLCWQFFYFLFWLYISEIVLFKNRVELLDLPFNHDSFGAVDRICENTTATRYGWTAVRSLRLFCYNDHLVLGCWITSDVVKETWITLLDVRLVVNHHDWRHLCMAEQFFNAWIGGWDRLDSGAFPGVTAQEWRREIRPFESRESRESRENRRYFDSVDQLG